jgi:hypothetical protein
MTPLLIVCLSILGLIVFIGIVRLIIEPSTGFFDFLGQLFLLDLLMDLFSSIVDSIGDLFD